VFPVVDHGRLVGIVTRSALLAELARTSRGLDVPRHVSLEN
jgi:CBS domain-containing protein